MRKLIFILLLFPLFLQAQSTLGKWTLKSNSNDLLGVNSMTDNVVTYKLNYATYNGSSSYSTKTSPTGFPTGDCNLTIAFWVYNMTTSGYPQAVTIKTSNSGSGGMICVLPYYNTTGRVDIEYYGGSCATATSTLTANAWHYIVMTHTAGGGNMPASCKIYIDGKSYAVANNGGSDGPLNLGAWSALWIGEKTETWGNFWAGNIRDVVIAGAVWTQTQIKQYYTFYTMP